METKVDSRVLQRELFYVIITKFNGEYFGYRLTEQVMEFLEYLDEKLSDSYIKYGYYSAWAALANEMAFMIGVDDKEYKRHKELVDALHCALENGKIKEWK